MKIRSQVGMVTLDKCICCHTCSLRDLQKCPDQLRRYGVRRLPNNVETSSVSAIRKSADRTSVSGRLLTTDGGSNSRIGGKWRCW